MYFLDRCNPSLLACLSSLSVSRSQQRATGLYAENAYLAARRRESSGSKVSGTKTSNRASIQAAQMMMV